MGYETIFKGSFYFNKSPSEKLKTYINSFSKTRHMKRDPEIIKKIDLNWKEHCFNGILGIEGSYYIKENTENDNSILNYNTPPSEQPGLWCDWIINECGNLCWDGIEKFYSYDIWLKYLIEHFFKSENLILNGEVRFEGQDSEDKGFIIVKNNIVSKIYDNEYIN